LRPASRRTTSGSILRASARRQASACWSGYGWGRNSRAIRCPAIRRCCGASRCFPG